MNLLLAAAAVGAFLAEAQRKRKEEEEAQRVQQYEGKGKRYGAIAKAYQASLDKFKAALIANGVSATEADNLKKEAIKNGSIASVTEKASNAITEAKAYEAWRAGERSGEQDIVDAWNAQQALEDFRAEERASYKVTLPKEEKSWWEKARNTVASSVTSVLSPVEKPGGAKVLAAPALQDDPPKKNWWEKLKENWNQYWQEQKKKSYLFYNAKGQDLVEPAGEDETLRAPDVATMKTYIAAAINVQRL